jgi:hypothetical protein
MEKEQKRRRTKETRKKRRNNSLELTLQRKEECNEFYLKGLHEILQVLVSGFNETGNLLSYQPLFRK